MGHIRNHSIIVEANYGDHIQNAHTKASAIFPYVSPISSEVVNGSRSFFIPPDGSKERWEESHEGDARREEFKKWLREQAYEDGSSPISWVEVWFGGGDRDAKIVSHGDIRDPL